MLKRLILFLVRTRLGIKKYELFRFIGQKTTAVYYFTSDRLTKDYAGSVGPSNVSLNWLLNKDCKIKRVFTR